MQTHEALFIAAAIYALLHFLILPVVRPAWNKRSLDGQIEKAPSIAVFEKMEQLALTAAIVFGAFSMLVLTVSAVSASSSAWILAGALKVIERSQEFFKRLSEIWSGVFFFLVFLLFGFLWYRTMKRQVLENIAEAIRQEAERIRAGKAEKLEPTAEMVEILRRLQAYLELESLQAGQADFERQRARLAGNIRSLENAFLKLDLERRIQLQWQQEAFPTEGRWQRMRRFLLSQGAFSRTKGVGTLLSRLTTALLFASLIGFQASPLQEALEGKVVKLRDFGVNLAASKAQRELQEARSAIPVV